MVDESDFIGIILDMAISIIALAAIAFALQDINYGIVKPVIITILLFIIMGSVPIRFYLLTKKVRRNNGEKTNKKI